MNFNSSEETVIWFRDRYSADELVLKPPYQRKPVWSAKQKCALIESILMGYPIPELYIQHGVNYGDGAEKSEYGVVDGQQRIRTVLQFIGIDKNPTEQESNSFALDKVLEESPFAGRTFKTLTTTERDRFLKYRFAVRYIDADDIEVRELFKRINRYVTKLNEPELRNATYTGPFMKLALELADDDYWVQSKLVTTAQIRRMKDVEFVSELLIGVIHGPQAGSAAAVTDYFVMYEDYDDEFPNQKQVASRFKTTLKLLVDILGTGSFTRFRSNRTDYYSLFVAVAVLSIGGSITKQQLPKVRQALQQLEVQVNQRLADETIKVSDDVVSYVRAAEKGVNDKKRRSDRHGVLLNLLQPYFK
jgi:Protein of unknown function DUF262